MRTPALIVLGYLLLLLSWGASNPPSSAPDEYAHYLRAIGVGRGEFTADQLPEPYDGAEPEQLNMRWQREQSRMIEVEGRVSAANINCHSTAPRFGWDCPPQDMDPNEVYEERTWVGTYPPYAYILPGVLMQLGDDAISALLWGRLGSALSAGALIVMAALVLWDRKRQWACLLGLIAAVTPMAIFSASGLTSSGPEIAAGVCFVASLLRLGRTDQKATRLVWVAAGVSGAALVLSRDLGIFWLGIAGLAFLGLTNLRPAWTRFRSGGATALTSVLIVVVAMAAAVAWQIMEQVSPPLDPNRILTGARNSLHITKEILRQQIGVFGLLDTVMPGLAYAAWAVLLGALGLAAFAVGTGRQRLVLLLSIASALILPTLLEAAQNQVGFGVQGRHVLPITVAVPLLAGEIIYRNPGRSSWFRATRPALWFGAIAGVVQFVGLYINGRQRMVGVGPPDFWNELSSSPPLGWPFWLVVGLAGGGLIAGFGWVASFGLPSLPRRRLDPLARASRGSIADTRSDDAPE
ncbi:hypothetical protein BH23ACT12_BH23ACT12_20760 [soil metagenome]